MSSSSSRTSLGLASSCSRQRRAASNSAKRTSRSTVWPIAGSSSGPGTALLAASAVRLVQPAARTFSSTPRTPAARPPPPPPPPPPPSAEVDLVSSIASVDLKNTSVYSKAMSAYATLLQKGSFVSSTPEWLSSPSTSAVPAHQSRWAFRSPSSLPLTPEDVAVLEERQASIQQANRRELEMEREALLDINKKLDRLLKALPSSFQPPDGARAVTVPSRLTMALSLAAEMTALNVSPNKRTYSLLIQICLATQDDRLAHTDDIALQKAAQRDLEGQSSFEFEADRLRKLIESSSWMERRPSLFQQHKRLQTDSTREIDSAWYGSTEWEVAWGLYEDAKLRGVKVDRVTLDSLIKLSYISDSLRTRVTAILGQAPSSSSGSNLPQPTATTIELLVAPYLRSKHSRYLGSKSTFNSLIADLDRVLAIYADFRSIGDVPTKEAVCQIAARLLRVGWSRAAVEMFLDFERSDPLVNVFDEEEWIVMLRGLCRVQHAIAMRNVWGHVVKSGRVQPDLGLVQDCQNLAGAAGLTDLVAECLEVFKERAVELQEHHYAPIVCAWAKVNDLEAAYHSLSEMRNDGVMPLPETAQPIVDLIVGKSDLTTEEGKEEVAGRVDEAWYALLDSKEERGSVDVTAANAVMQACLTIPDFVRATETFNEFGTLEVTPDLETYHLLLDALLLRPSSSAELFDMIIQRLQENEIAYTAATYERVIAFICTQPVKVWSSKAFDHLEEFVQDTKRKIRLSRSTEMHPDVVGPSYRTFEVMLERCAHEKDPRAIQLTEDMRSFGFTPHNTLMRKLVEANLLGGTVPNTMTGFGLAENKVPTVKERQQRATHIWLDRLPLSSDGQIPPHVRNV